MKKEPDSPSRATIVLNATSEFCRALGDIPTYGQAGNREEIEKDELEVSTTCADLPELSLLHNGISTVKSVLSGHSKIDKTKSLMKNGSSMKV